MDAKEIKPDSVQQFSLSHVFTEKALEQEASTNAVNASSQLIDSTGTGSLCDLVRSQYAIAAGPREDSRTDHVNFRLLMWKTMMSFPEVAENRSRDVVPLLLRFMR